MLSIENESVEVLRDARLFARWIRQGVMTVAEARNQILFTARQLQIIRKDNDSQVLADVARRRTETWNALLRLLSAEARRKQAPVETAPLKRKAASAS